MSKRPLCIAALVWAAILWLLTMAGFPFLGFEPPVLPEGADSGHVLLTGVIYKKDVYDVNTNLYLKKTNLILNSENYPIDAIKVTVENKNINEDVCVGSKIALSGRLEEIPLPGNPGQFNERVYYYARKIKWYCQAYEIQILDKDREPILVFREKIKNKLRKGIYASVPERDAKILEAMILGDKGNIEKEDILTFQIMGCSHILAVSGIHLTILGGGLYRILRKLCLPAWAAGVLSAGMMFFYGGITGSGAAVMRAAVMFAMAAGAFAVKRTYDFLSAAALSAILLLAESPLYLYDSGFLLSFGAIVGLGIVHPVIFPKKKKRKMEKITEKIKAGAADGLRSGISVWCVLLPLTMYFFFEVPLLGIFVNLLVLPTAGFILISGISGGILGILPVGVFGKAAGIPAVLGLETYLGAGEQLRNLGGALWITGKPKLWKCVCYYAVMMLVLWWIGKKKEVRRGRSLPMLYGFILGCLVLMVRIPGRHLLITFLDVGQGDCACVQTEEGNCYLVDGGSSSVSKVGRYRIIPFLKASGIRKIEGIFLSHMDEDHINGVIELLEMIRERETAIRVETLFLSKCRDTEEEQKELENLGKEAGCTIVYIEKGTRITEKNMVIECLSPQSDDMESNEGSQVLKLTQGKVRVLFTGDMEGRGEEETVEVLKARQESFELLKVAHHGSKNSTKEEFLEYVNPGAAVISCGQDNRYGHPHRELLERLETQTEHIFLTYMCGAVSALQTGDSFRISCYKPFQ